MGDTVYVRDSAANTFRLAATSGGALIENTADGTAYFVPGETANALVASGDFTGGASEDIFNCVAHGLEDGDVIRLVHATIGIGGTQVAGATTN